MLSIIYKNIFYKELFLKNFSFRIIISLLLSFFLSLCMVSAIIKYFKNLKIHQIIRSYNPPFHLKKNKVPTMGGIVIIFSIFITLVICSNLSDPYIFCVLLALFGYGIIGFIDDYLKIIKKNYQGLTIKWKYFLQSIMGIIIIYIIMNLKILNIQNYYFFSENFLKNNNFFIFVYYIFMYFIIIGSTNAVNLTDGLDGLAIMLIIFIALGLSSISIITNDKYISNYLNITYFKHSKELVIVCTSIIGSGLGFLWFNSYPAKIFMGDIGSLALGGTIGTIAILLHQEFLLMFIGGIFVIETLSVILQVIFFKFYKKRIFLMAPIHHHYELKGYSETHITIRFWIITFLLLLIGLILKTYNI